MEVNEHEKKEGWIWKPKEMLRVMWDQRWINASKLDYYTIRGQKDEKFTVVQETPMLRLMDQCNYFLEEDTQLHYIGKKLGATVDRTPKCHP